MSLVARRLLFVISVVVVAAVFGAVSASASVAGYNYDDTPHPVHSGRDYVVNLVPGAVEGDAGEAHRVWPLDGAVGASLTSSGVFSAPRGAVGLETRGIRPAPGTRVRPEGIPENWRIRGTRDPGGTWYYDPANKGNAVRVMQGNPNSPFPNSQSPYVRWQQNGHPLDVWGNKLPTARTPDAHIPLGDFRFLSELFR